MKFRYVCKYIRYYKKMAMVILSGILLAAVLGIAGTSLLMAFHQMLEEDAHNNYGYWTMKLQMNKMEMEVLPQLSEVEKIGKQKYCYSAKYKNDEGCYMDILESDDACKELLNVKMHTGKMPSNENEIALSANYLVDGVIAYKVYKPGDKITITLGTRTKSDGNVFGVYKKGNEKYEVVQQKEYIISGIVDDLSETKGEVCTGYTYKEEIPNPSVMYLKMTENEWNVKINNTLDQLQLNRKQDVFDITNFDDEMSLEEEDYKAVLNGELLYYMNNNLVSNNNKRFVSAVILFLIIAYCMVIIMIVNVYSAALLKRKKEYAVFRMLGMEQKDLTQMGLLEGVIFWIVGWIIGAVLSAGITKMMFVIIQKLRIREMQNLKMYFSPVLVVIIGILLLAAVELSILLAIWIDSKKSIHQRLTGSAKKSFKYRSFSYFPTTIALGIRNAVRVKSRLAFNLISYTLCIFLMFAMYLVSTNMKVTKLIDGIDEATSEFYIYASHFPDVDEYLEKMPYAKETWLYVTSSVEKETKETILKEEYLDTYAQDWVNIAGLSPKQYEIECPTIAEKMSYEEWVEMDAAILVDVHVKTDGTTEYILNLPDSGTFAYKAQNEGAVQYDAGEFKYFTRMKKEDVKITEASKNYGGNGVFFLFPMEKYNKQFNHSYSTMLVHANAKEGYEYQLAEWIDKMAIEYHYNYMDNITDYLAQKDTKLTVQIGMGMICVFLFFINICNTRNIIKTNYIMREQEMGVLRAIGLSIGQLSFMQIAESCFSVIMATILANAGVLLLQFIPFTFGMKIQIPLLLNLLIFGLNIFVVVLLNVPEMLQLRKNNIYEIIRYTG